MNKEQLAYLAGLTDGEGSILCANSYRGAPCGIQFRISMGTIEPLRTVSGWFGARLHTESKGQGHRPQCRLTLTGDRACALLEEMLPYLLLKRDQAEVALRIQALRYQARRFRGRRGLTGQGGSLSFPEDLRAEMDSLQLKLKELKQGHRVDLDPRADQLGWPA